MLAALLTAASLTFSLPTGTHISRRDAVMVGLASSFISAQPAFAEMYGEGKAPKVNQRESLEKAKEFKYSARPVAGESETPEFLAAEKKRIEAQKARDAGQKLKEETIEEQLARLGLKAAS